MERLCEKTFDTPTNDEDLLKDVDVPKFDDTLEEIEFILQLGQQLKDEGKLNFCTPPRVPFGVIADKKVLSVQMNVVAQSSPKAKQLLPSTTHQRLSNIISPIDQNSKHSALPCRTGRANFVSQVKVKT